MKTSFPHPPTQPTLSLPTHVQPLLAHWTSLIGSGLVIHLSTWRNVSSRARNWLRSQGAKFGGFFSSVIVDAVEGRNFVVLAFDWMEEVRAVSLGVEVGLANLNLFGAGSCTTGSDVVEALLCSLFTLSEVLEGFEMDSKIAWNFRFVVLRAGISDYLTESPEFQRGISYVHNVRPIKRAYRYHYACVWRLKYVVLDIGLS